MISIFDIFKVGLGPSSSHTVGPMKAACQFVHQLHNENLLTQTERVVVEIYGSLALTGDGHGTFDAVLLGLEGDMPESIALDSISQRIHHINEQGCLKLNGQKVIDFEVARDLVVLYSQSLPKHPNGLYFVAYNKEGQRLADEIYYSIGGGFIVTDNQFSLVKEKMSVPHPFHNGQSLLQMCYQHEKSIAQLVMENEMAIHQQNKEEIHQKIRHIAQTMFHCLERGLQQEGTLPGGLKVRRRAPDLAKKLNALREAGQVNTHLWPMVFAMAVSEENASGGRVVTAPTNGAAGIIPSVLNYYRHFHPQSSEEGIETFLLTAGAIGILYQMNASISGADVGCQGEVGVACSMAAGAFSAVCGGTPQQIETAAEMAMEHHLGLTCDPVGGLVQIPCIERNGIASETAIRLASLSLLEDGTSKKVTLDEVMKTMLQTGRDMKNTYKETALGGLAATLKQKPIKVSVKVIEC